LVLSTDFVVFRKKNKKVTGKERGNNHKRTAEAGTQELQDARAWSSQNLEKSPRYPIEYVVAPS
jgi:hypothetical protein